MKNKLTSVLIISLFSLAINNLVASSVLALNPPVHCTNNPEDYQPEEPSKLTRIIKLDKFGFSITVPANYRAMLKNNGTIEIMDNGTFKLTYCGDKINIPVGRGSEALIISKSREYLYSNVVDKVSNKPKMFFVIKTSYDTRTIYRTMLRLRTSKGIIDLEIDGIPTDNKEDALKEIENLHKLADNIRIHN